MTTQAWTEISLSAAQHNLSVVKQAAPAANIMSVIKANAYGHGAVELARALINSDALAIARIEEGIELRQHGIDKQIAVLSGAVSKADLAACAEYGLTPVIHSLESCQSLLELDKKLISIWLKIDTGMHRLGLNQETLASAIKLLHAAPHISLAGIASHLANGEVLDTSANEIQQQQFERLAHKHHITTRSLANSAGILFHPAMHYEWVRPGIMLYGCNPGEHENAFTRQLKPVMSLKSRVIKLKTVKAGECVGYNGIWQAGKDSQIATIAIGYADGYPRHAQNGTPVLINGKQYPLAGRVSMDLITVDVSASNVKMGDEVTLWGEGLSANLIAQHAQTISYELFTGVTQRVKRNYI